MNQPKQVAAVVTEYIFGSHADVIVTKLLEGYNYDHGAGPNMKLVSLYVDQFPKRDISRALAKKYGFTIYDTIEAALTRGGKTLAVDGVLSIGEHGTYPHNAKGQHLHPRRRFFTEITKVFEKSGKAVPVFNDKHLAATWEDGKWMYDRARELFVPFMAGSSIPLTFRQPPLQLPRGCPLTEAVQICYSSLEAYGFHALDTLQCMVERRKGFETGVKAVWALQGEAMWKEFDRGGWSKPLLEAALAKVPSHKPGDVRELTARDPQGAIYFLEYRDGLRALVVMVNGWYEGGGGTPITFAGKLKGQDEPLATHFYVQEPMPYAHFIYLVKAIDSMMQTGHPPYPVERTLLSGGILDTVMTSLYEKGKRLETPHLAIKYTPTDWPFATDPIPKAIPRTEASVLTSLGLAATLKEPKKIAAVVTEYRRDSHAEVILGKILDGYNHDGGDRPNLKLVSLYVDQFPDRDLSRDLARKHGFKIYDTIEGALTLGGDELAVDGVLCIGEHGNYPTNAKGQILYPRRRFFEGVTKVFEDFGRGVPVFNDKHLAVTWADAKWMYDRARKLAVPFLAGSSLPVTFRRPPLELPRGCELVEAVQIGYGPLEAYGFHALEALQCLAERRKGFETGVKAVQALRGEAMWKEFDRGGWSANLLKAAMAEVPQHLDGDYRRLTAQPKSEAALYLIEYHDGFRAAVALMNGWIDNGEVRGGPFAFAGRLKGQEKPALTRFYLQDVFPYVHFAYLLRAIDSMMQTGHPPYPVERTLLTTGVLDALMTSLADNGRRLETPHLAVKYTPTDWPFATGPVPKAMPR